MRMKAKASGTLPDNRLALKSMYLRLVMEAIASGTLPDNLSWSRNRMSPLRLVDEGHRRLEAMPDLRGIPQQRYFDSIVAILSAIVAQNRLSLA